MDKNGLSDPYCIVYENKREVNMIKYDPPFAPHESWETGKIVVNVHVLLSLYGSTLSGTIRYFQ